MATPATTPPASAPASLDTLLDASQALETALADYALAHPGARINAASTLQSQVTRCLNALVGDAALEQEQLRRWRSYATAASVEAAGRIAPRATSHATSATSSVASQPAPRQRRRAGRARA